MKKYKLSLDEIMEYAELGFALATLKKNKKISIFESNGNILIKDIPFKDIKKYFEIYVKDEFSIEILEDKPLRKKILEENKELYSETEDKIYKKKIKVVHPVKDVEKANKYLKSLDKNLRDYLEEDDPGLFKAIKSIIYKLDNKKEGNVKITTNKELNNIEKARLDDWILSNNFFYVEKGFLDQNFFESKKARPCLVLDNIGIRG